MPLKRLCLDTNIYIIGTQNSDSEEAEILSAIGYYGRVSDLLDVEVILSPELIDQIRRVGKYLWGKDRVGFVLGLILSRLNIHYVSPDSEWNQLLEELNDSGQIPSEDIEIFLSAKLGETDCFVASNRKLIRAIAEFECLTPVDFIKKYL
ncbi:MAG: hypothetical protein AAGA60_19220 [Cyanobacteria bacterium P01_E01_bin.42]